MTVTAKLRRKRVIEKYNLELEAVLSRKVDVAERCVIAQDRNWIRRNDILSTAETVYAS